MPDNLTNCSGCSERPQHASTIAAVTESWPQPAHKVDMLPSYWRRVSPSSLVGSDGWATFGLLMYDIDWLVVLAGNRAQARRLGKLCADFIDDGLRRYRQSAVAQNGKQLGFLDRGLQRQQG